MLRSTYVRMCQAFPGGTAAMAAALGYTVDALRNRIYERKGQCVNVDDALMMQDLSGTKLFANEIAQQSGGVFLEVIPPTTLERAEILTEFNQLVQSLGELSREYELSVRDGRINSDEKRALRMRAYVIHKQVERLLAISFAIYSEEDEDESSCSGQASDLAQKDR